jgi:hypothetical protein
MPQDNIAEFGRQLVRAVGILFASHPKAVDLRFRDLIAGSPQNVTGEQTDVANGTLQWLVRNGVVDGSYNNSVIGRAQLTARALGLLMRSQPNLGGQGLGEAAVALRSQSDERTEEIVAELLTEELTGL